jgi:aerobic-type carbon monoxide dehydrogenase small subunit (CoxS/CutS family)
LRNDLALNGPKLGCGSGLCGACTVHVEGRSVRACQLPIKALAPHSRITTLEGLGTPERPPCRRPSLPSRPCSAATARTA